MSAKLLIGLEFDGEYDPRVRAELEQLVATLQTWQGKVGSSDAQYLVAVASDDLSAERVGVNSPTVRVDYGTPGFAKWHVDGSAFGAGYMMGGGGGGDDGADGPPGPSIPGANGSTGAQGPQGVAGTGIIPCFDGEDGERWGFPGPQGNTGATGATGATSFTYLNYQEQQTLGTAGGTFTTGAWRTRVLNTEVSDTGGLGTLASNQITLNAGTYIINATAPGYNCNGHQLRLQNVTDASTVLTGSTAFSRTGASASQAPALLSGVFTIGAAKALELQHSCETTAATIGLGVPASQSTEVYANVELFKIS